jgi:hypothetical protein
MPARTLSRQSYSVGIICVLDVEKAAVKATLDEEHNSVQRTAGDDNVYMFKVRAKMRTGSYHHCCCYLSDEVAQA